MDIIPQRIEFLNGLTEGEQLDQLVLDDLLSEEEEFADLSPGELLLGHHQTTPKTPKERQLQRIMDQFASDQQLIDLEMSLKSTPPQSPMQTTTRSPVNFLQGQHFQDIQSPKRPRLNNSK